MKFTQQQQTAIDSRGRIIVSADAGSGKTSVMIERLVSLILGGADVREVLCVTFTKKAAAQLRDKLRSALMDRISKGEQKERLKEQLKELPLAEIGTIHSFCGRLIRTNFYLAETDAAFRIISPDDAEGGSLMNRAIDRVFERAYAEKDSDFYRLLSVYFRGKKDAALRRIVRSVHAEVRGLADYEQLLSHAGEDTFSDACDLIRGYYQGRAEFMLKTLGVYRTALFAYSPKAEAVCQAVTQACEALVRAEDLFAMCGCVLPQIPSMPSSAKAQGETLRAVRFLSMASRDIKKMYAQLSEISGEAAERAYFEDSALRAKSIAKLVLAFDGEYAVLKREANVLDYNDLEHLALKVLASGEGRKSLKERYRYIFVDEYQDVNPVQEKIVSLLSGGEEFLVGDSKQAIYGFRGSNSSFFEKKREQLRAEGGDLPLSMNFRSAPEILEAVNTVFLPLLNGFTGMVPCDRYGGFRGQVCIHQVDAKKEKKEKTDMGIYSVPAHTGAAQLGTADSEETSPLTQRIAAIIEDELTKTVFDADLARERKVEFSDIAVLVRKKSEEGARLIRELERRGIPVAASSKVNVCDFPEARLLIDVLSYLDDAEQDIPLASTMLSALGGFSDEELCAIRLRFKKTYAFRTACSYVAGGRQDDPLAQKMRAFFSRIAVLRMQAQMLSAQEMLSMLLAEGLQAQICAMPQGKLRLARVRRLVAESAQTGSVHAFLAWLKASDFCVYYTGGGGENAVQVLTMHASKGLEYPVVILADLDVPFHAVEKKEIMWTERYLICPKSFDAERGIARETIPRRASELVLRAEQLVGEKNLLYVAMTRAKYRLHLVLSSEVSERAISPAYAGRFSDFLDLAALARYQAEDITPRPPLERHAFAGKADEARVEEVLSAMRAEYPFEESVSLPVKSSASELMQEESGNAPRGGGHTIEEGLAYHGFLEHVRFGADVREELARMREEKLLSEERLALLDADSLEKILALPSLKEAAAKRSFREQTFLIALPACEMLPVSSQDEVLFQGAIDLLMEGEDGYTVVDYKYSARGDEEIKKHYALQIRLYKKAVAHAMGVDERTVKARIVNIAKCREIAM